jgi:hypothetical protein
MQLGYKRTVFRGVLLGWGDPCHGEASPWTYPEISMEIAMIQNRTPVQDEITHRAYALYLMRGCEHGRDVEDWVKATREVTDELNLRVVNDGG